MARNAAKGSQKAKKAGGFSFSLPFGLQKATKGARPPVAKPTGPRPWTTTEERLLKALRESGLSPRVIALRLGRSEAAILAKIQEQAPPTVAT